MTTKIRKLYNVLVIGGVIAAGACKKADQTTAPLAGPVAKPAPVAPAPKPEPTPAAKPEDKAATGVVGWH